MNSLPVYYAINVQFPIFSLKDATFAPRYVIVFDLIIVKLLMRSSQSNTRVHILRNPQNWYAHIIVSPAVESVTYVFTIDTTEGAICYSGTPMIDVFPTHRGAYECIRSKFDSVCMKEAKGLIGACIDNGKLVIAVIEACRRSATLPGGHTVKRIEKVSFVTIPLLAQANKGGQYALGKFRVNDNHFYSESVDLTRPYPSGHDTHDYDHQFCWNEKWRAPFVQRGAPFACVVMLQGYCGSCDSTTYIARRSVLNPLTRYSARGLNETGSPGNEIECELIFAVGEKCASNCWRRGSVPIAWRTNVVVMATHVVHDEEMWKKQTHSYFKGISDRFGGVPVQVVCLLDHDQNEMKVSKAYENAVSGIENVRFVNYDLKAVEESVVVADTERLLEPFMSEHAFNTEEGKQKLLLRFNCADSLDRTNIATFAWARILARAQGVGENVMKWLVKAFLESGDVVSILCAGTEACRSQAIRRLAAGTEDAKSDKLIGIERRLGYLFVDNERDKSIMAWITETEGHKNVFNVDPMHLSLMNTSSDIPPSVNESVIGLDQTVGLLKCSSASHEILIRLPQPMVLTVFRILLLPSVPSMRPPRAFALSCGSNVNSRYVWMNSVPLPEVREPTLMRYSLRHAEKWNIQVPHDIKALEPASFVWVTFVNESNEINIGNISIDCEIPSRFTRYKSTNMRWSLDRLNEYKEQLGQVTGNTRPSLKDYASLELARVQKGISVTERNIALACMGFNPSVGDIRHYLRQQQGECSYCWSPLNDSDVAVSLHRKLKCVLSPTRSDDSIHKFPICCECTESLQSSEEVISELESRVLSGTDTVDFSPKRWVLEDFGDRVNVAVGPSARFYQFPDGAGDIN